MSMMADALPLLLILSDFFLIPGVLPIHRCCYVKELNLRPINLRRYHQLLLSSDMRRKSSGLYGLLINPAAPACINSSICGSWNTRWSLIL